MRMFWGAVVGGIVIAVDPVQSLRMIAISELLGRHVGSDQLISAAVDAVLAGVAGEALAQLAGLGRAEEPEAHGLFGQVVHELGLTPTLPVDPRVARWELVRWWCQLIVTEELRPEIGGRLIWFDGWNELDCPEALQSLVGWVSEWDDWDPNWNVPRETYAQRITEAAEQLLHQPWPPPSP